MKKRKKGGNWLVIALTVLIGFGAVAGVYALSNGESESKKDESPDVVQEYTLTVGNDYTPGFEENNTRACIQPYVITIPAGVILTAKDGYQFGVYSVSDESKLTSGSLLTNQWVDLYTITSEGKYGIAIKKIDNSAFDFTTDSNLISSYITSSNSKIWEIK